MSRRSRAYSFNNRTKKLFLSGTVVAETNESNIATISGLLDSNTQANITSVGTLDSVTATGNITTNSGYFLGNGSQLTGLSSTVKTYVDNEISGLVDSAPATLNTLNEIASALGDDPNLATTLTNTITTANVNLKGYVDGEITTVNSTITTANTNVVGYVDSAVSTANVNLKGYVDAGNTNVVGYVDSAVSTANVNLKGYIDNEIATIPPGYSNSNVASLLSNFGANNISTTGTISTSGSVIASGRVATDEVSGHGISGTTSLTLRGGVSSDGIKLQFFDSDWTDALAIREGTHDILASYPFTATGNITASGNVTGGNLITAGSATITGDLAVGNPGNPANITVSNDLIATNQVSGNELTDGVLTITVGTITGADSITASGNITTSGGYFLGNGSQLTGIVSGGGGTYTADSSAPGSPSSGDFWYNTSTDIIYQYIDDGTSSYWVDRSSESRYIDQTYNNAVYSGNVTATRFIGDGSQLTGLPESYSNAQVTSHLLTYTGNITAGNITVSGTMTAGSIVETSTMRIKENINPIINGLDAILNLKGVTYDRLDNHKHEAGLIAEQVNKVLPDLVAKDADGNPSAIQYTKLTAYLIEAIKELNAEIEKLKGKR